MPLRPVKRDGVGRGVTPERLRDDDLNDVSGGDVLFRAEDFFAVIVFAVDGAEVIIPLLRRGGGAADGVV